MQEGLRFGNGEKNITSVCLWVPAFMGGGRMYVIPGSAPFLFGRSILEALDVTVNYAPGQIRRDKKKRQSW